VEAGNSPRFEMIVAYKLDIVVKFKPRLVTGVIDRGYLQAVKRFIVDVTLDNIPAPGKPGVRLIYVSERAVIKECKIAAGEREIVKVPPEPKAVYIGDAPCSHNTPVVFPEEVLAA
jgi:hypothetical protein